MLNEREFLVLLRSCFSFQSSSPLEVQLEDLDSPLLPSLIDRPHSGRLALAVPEGLVRLEERLGFTFPDDVDFAGILDTPGSLLDWLNANLRTPRE